MMKMCDYAEKNIAIIGLFYHPKMPSRVEMVYKYYREKSAKVTIITSDFVHPTKSYDKESWFDCVKIHVPKYNKNFSLRRIVSHIVFGISIEKELNRLQPQLVYICIPPNYSAFRAARWANKNGVSVVTDVIDIWPNANAPTNIFLKKIYNIWGAIRESAIKRSNIVVLECALYRDSIYGNNFVVPLSKKINRNPVMDVHDGIRIAYLGAFSTSYDFDTLVYIAKRVKEQGIEVCVYLIGDGDEKKGVISLLKETGVETIDCGIVYDEDEKTKILEKCDFGYNGFKLGMTVGQSYKSLDYMGCGLALINSLEGELKELIKSEECGYNITLVSRDEVAMKISNLTPIEINKMRKKSFDAFCKYYSWDSYKYKMDECMRTI